MDCRADEQKVREGPKDKQSPVDPTPLQKMGVFFREQEEFHRHPSNPIFLSEGDTARIAPWEKSCNYLIYK